MLRVGVVGTGLIATLKHLPAWRRAGENASLVALCDVDAQRVQEVAGKLSIPKTYTSTRAMYESEKLDIVDICTPPKTHKALAVEALEAGVHVLLEKPMATSLAECDAIIEAARRKDRKVCLAHSDLFYPAFVKARESLASGAVGAFAGMRIFLSTPVDYITSKTDHWAHKLRGGVLGETGPHVVYMTLAFINPISSVQIHAQKLLPEFPWSPYEDYRLNLIGERAASSITLIYTSRHWAAEVDLFGRDGFIRADLESQSVSVHRRDALKPSTVGISTLREAAGMVGSAARAGFDLAIGRHRTTHDVLVQRFIESVRDGAPSPVPPEDGRESVRVLDLLMDQLEGSGARPACAESAAS